MFLKRVSVIVVLEYVFVMFGVLVDGDWGMYCGLSMGKCDNGVSTCEASAVDFTAVIVTLEFP